MKIPPQASAIPAQTKPMAAQFLACLVAPLAAFACHAPERTLPPNAPALASASPAASVSTPVSAATLSSGPSLALAPPVVPPATSVPRSPHHYAVAAIGDSLTDPRSHGGGYLEYLRTRCPGIELDNFGKGGTMVNQMRRSFDERVAASGKRYTHLIVFGGVNDLYSDLTAFRTPAKIEADLGYMYDWAHAHGVRVVALTVAPWGGFERYFNPSRATATHDLNAWIRDQAGPGRIDQVVDAYALLSCGDPDRLCERFVAPFKDGLHFGPEGHQILGQALFQSAFSDCE